MSELYCIPVYRVTLVREPGRMIPEEALKNSWDVAKIAEVLLEDADREHFLVFLLDCKNRLIGVNETSVGVLTGSMVHPREVFKPAILANAHGIIAVHNHPSGDPTPSGFDFDMFHRLREAGEILGIALLDWIIVGHGCHYAASRHGDL